MKNLPEVTARSAEQWAVIDRVLNYAIRVAHGVLDDKVQEELALSSLSDEVWRIIKAGKYNFTFDDLDWLAQTALDKGIQEIDIANRKTLDKMINAATASYCAGDVAAATRAAAQVARQASPPPPVSYVRWAFDEAMIRVRKARARMRRVRA